MGDYYRHARAIRTYSELAIEQCRARVRRAPARRRACVEVEDGFRVVGDHLEIPHAAHLRERPLRLLSAFAVAQDNDVPLSRTARAPGAREPAPRSTTPSAAIPRPRRRSCASSTPRSA